jgi:S-adenosylmethionine-dependent methyltransferase
LNKVTGANFDDGFANWKAYQEAPWGKLRYRVAQANLQNHLPPPPAHILDLGGGNGLDSVPLVKEGYTAVILDFSQEMIAQGQKLAQKEQISDKIRFKIGDATQFTTEQPQFDIILCHNVLQYVEEGTAVLHNIHQNLRPGGIFSLIITNPFTETFAHALRDTDLQAALDSLNQSTKYIETFDTTIQYHTDSELKVMLNAAGFTLLEQYGVRCICDFIADNERKFEPGFYAQLERLETAVSNQYPYKLLARFYQFISQKQLGI